jgi:hypothetical protein
MDKLRRSDLLFCSFRIRDTRLTLKSPLFSGIFTLLARFFFLLQTCLQSSLSGQLFVILLPLYLSATGLFSS